MPNTYTQIHIQAIFVVKKRHALIHEKWKNELYKFLTGIIHGYGHKLLAINGMPDHIHILFGMRPAQSLSDLLQHIKGSSSRWINTHQSLPVNFEWQEGYGAFSYSKSEIPKVVRYIENQEEHHRKLTCQEEYKIYLEKLEVDFEDRFIFKDLE